MLGLGLVNGQHCVANARHRHDVRVEMHAELITVIAQARGVLLRLLVRYLTPHKVHDSLMTCRP